jgi:hypothetical protein
MFGGNNDASGSHGENGNHEECIHKGPIGSIPSHSQVARRATPRPYYCTFRNTQQTDYNSLNWTREEIQGTSQGDSELGSKATKMEMPTFDGTNQILAKEWVKKLDVYLQLTTMEEGNSIKYATLHLMGKAHDVKIFCNYK